MTWKTSDPLRPVKLRYSPEKINEFIVLTRLSLYNTSTTLTTGRASPYGAMAIRNELEKLDIQPLPSLSRIGRVLRKFGLTHRRTGFY